MQEALVKSKLKVSGQNLVELQVYPQNAKSARMEVIKISVSVPEWENSGVTAAI